MNGRLKVIVVGLGAWGSSAAFHLARRGVEVLGIDRFVPPHPHGSTHGVTRAFSFTSPLHPSEEALIQRSYELWSELAGILGQPTMYNTGALYVGAPDSAMVVQALTASERQGLSTRELNSAELRRRFPAIRLLEREVAVFEPTASVVFPEFTVEAHLRLARTYRARIRVGSRSDRGMPRKRAFRSPQPPVVTKPTPWCWRLVLGPIPSAGRAPA